MSHNRYAIAITTLTAENNPIMTPAKWQLDNGVVVIPTWRSVQVNAGCCPVVLRSCVMCNQAC